MSERPTESEITRLISSQLLYVCVGGEEQETARSRDEALKGGTRSYCDSDGLESGWRLSRRGVVRNTKQLLCSVQTYLVLTSFLIVQAAVKVNRISVVVIG